MVYLWFQRSAEDRSVSCWTPEEDPDQRADNEAPRWWPVTHWICVATSASAQFEMFDQWSDCEGTGCRLTLPLYPHALEFAAFRRCPLVNFISASGQICPVITRQTFKAIWLLKLDYLLEFNELRKTESSNTVENMKLLSDLKWGHHVSPKNDSKSAWNMSLTSTTRLCWYFYQADWFKEDRVCFCFCFFVFFFVWLNHTNKLPWRKKECPCPFTEISGQTGPKA